MLLGSMRTAWRGTLPTLVWISRLDATPELDVMLPSRLLDEVRKNGMGRS